MTNNDTATTLVSIGAALQVVVGVLVFIGGAASSIGTALNFLTYGFSDFFTFFFWTLIPGVPLMVFGFIGVIFSIQWFKWRHSPVEHRQKLITTGVVAMALIFTAFLPGLLVLIGGSITTTATA